MHLLRVAVRRRALRRLLLPVPVRGVRVAEIRKYVPRLRLLHPAAVLHTVAVRQAVAGLPEEAAVASAVPGAAVEAGKHHKRTENKVEKE